MFTLAVRNAHLTLLLAGTCLTPLSTASANELGVDSADISGDDIVVTGSALQSQAEIQARRDSAAIIDTLSQDEIGAMPDITVAESLRRITGVTTIYNDDIGQFASIRGTHPDFVPVSVNGLMIATTGDLGEGTRKVNLQVIPGQGVQQLRAFKTLSPDLDAGALGGLIDIVTVSAFDTNRSLLNATAGISFSSYMKVPDINSAGDSKSSPFGKSLSLTYAPRFGANKEWGLAITGIYETRPRTQSNNAITNRLYYTDAGVTTNPLNANWNGIAVPNSFVTHNYTNKFTKYGGTARLEYQPSSRFSSSLFGFLFISDEQETRNTNRVFNLDQPLDTTETTGSVRVRQTDIQWRYNTFERTQWGLQSLNELTIGDRGKLGFKAGYSNAWFRSDRPYVEFRANPNTRLTYDLNNIKAPFELANSAYYTNAANYRVQTLYVDQRDSEEDIYEARIDYDWNNKAADRGFGFAVGANYRKLDLSRDNTSSNYVAGTVSLTGLAIDPKFNAPSYGSNILWLDQQTFFQDIVPNIPINTAESARLSLVDDYRYQEDITASYFNANFTTDAFRVDLGARLDHIRYTARMAQVVGGVLQDDFATHGSKSTRLLPYSTFNLSLSDGLRLKAAASQTLGRPNPESIATVENIDYTELTIERGNPNIKPRRSTNLDLGFEYFFNGGAGMITLTGFHKQVKDDILAVSAIEEIDGDLWNVTQPINGEKTSYKGIEFGFINSSFKNVHPLLNKLGGSLNFTWIKGKSGFLVNGERMTRDLLQYQADFAANAAIFYDLGGQSELRLSMNHQGRYLEEFAANHWQEIYIEPFTSFDLTARWAVSDALQLRLEGRNIFGANRARSTGLNHEYFRAGMEIGNSWFLRANLKL